MNYPSNPDQPAGQPPCTNFVPATGAPIERRTKLSAVEFFNEYALKNRPVVIADAMEGWPALEKWTPRFFAENFSDKQVKLRDGSELPMREFIDRVLASSPRNPAPYWTNAPMREHFPALLSDINADLPYFKLNWALRHYLHKGLKANFERGSQIEIYIGGNGGAFPVLHWDGLGSHAFLMQIYGKKRYYAWPPEDSACMYAKEDSPNISPIRDVENPDLGQYPLFAKARLTTFLLEPGELLFVPSRWWHTAKMLSPSITLSINTFNRSNWANLVEDMTRNLGRGGRAGHLVKRTYFNAAGLSNRFLDLFQT